MSAESVLAVLNELLASEQRAIAPRLFESTVFVSSSSVAVAELADQMKQQSERCQLVLAGRIRSLDGEPRLRCGNVTSADLHFQDLHCVLPRLITDQQRLVAKYRSAGERLGGDAETAALVSRFLEAHERELEALTALGTVNAG